MRGYLVHFPSAIGQCPGCDVSRLPWHGAMGHSDVGTVPSGEIIYVMK